VFSLIERIFLASIAEGGRDFDNQSKAAMVPYDRNTVHAQLFSKIFQKAPGNLAVSLTGKSIF